VSVHMTPEGLGECVYGLGGARQRCIMTLVGPDEAVYDLAGPTKYKFYNYSMISIIIVHADDIR
jgi:hypothetical protein